MRDRKIPKLPNRSDQRSAWASFSGEMNARWLYLRMRGLPAMRDAQYMSRRPDPAPEDRGQDDPGDRHVPAPGHHHDDAGGMMTSLGIGTTELSIAIRKMMKVYPPVSSDRW
jgi:hypothetical protein